MFLCMVICCLLWFFFFFKQKPAYEMRISDWSSDVCSSDLLEQRPAMAAERQRPAVHTDCEVQIVDRLDVGGEPRSLVPRFCSNEIGAGVDRHPIGRASCRERVGQ